MDNSFELPPLPDFSAEFRPRWPGDPGGFSAYQLQAYAITAQSELIGRLAQMQEHEAIEWVLKARQDWWKS